MEPNRISGYLYQIEKCLRKGEALDLKNRFKHSVEGSVKEFPVEIRRINLYDKICALNV